MKYRQYQVINNLKKERSTPALDQFRILKVITNIGDIIISRKFLMSLDSYFLDLKLNEDQMITLIKEAEIYDIAFLFKDMNIKNMNKIIQFELNRKLTNLIQTKELRHIFLIDQILDSQDQLYLLIIQDLIQFLTNVYSHKFEFTIMYDWIIKMSYLVINNENLIQSQSMLTWMDKIIDLAHQKKDTNSWFVIIDNIMSSFIQPEFGQFQPILVAQLWISKLSDFSTLFLYFGPYIIGYYPIDLAVFENLLKYKASPNSIKFATQLCQYLINFQKTLLTELINLFKIFYDFFRDSRLIEPTLEFLQVYLGAMIIDKSLTTELIDELKKAFWNHDQSIRKKITHYVELFHSKRTLPQYSQVYYKTGIKNIQNTCYFGSFMQILFQSKQFVEKIKNYKNDTPFLREDNVFESLSKMFCYLYYQKEIVEFFPIQQFRSIRNDYHFAIQHDVGEFILHFFEDLENKNKQEYKSIKPLFVGIQQSQLKCLNCGSTRIGPEEECLMLSLSIIEKMSVQQLIAGLQEEKVQLDCPCGQGRNFEKTINFVKTQQYLFIQLNRFQYNQGVKEKIFSNVKIDRAIQIQKKVGIQSYLFYGMINHIGQSSEIGHYISYTVIQSRNYRFDDGNAIEMLQQPEKFFQPFETPYILCYKAA